MARADVFGHRSWKVRTNMVQNSANAGASVDVGDAVAGVIELSSDFVITNGIDIQGSMDGTTFGDPPASTGVPGTVGEQAGAQFTVAASGLLPIPVSMFGFKYLRIKPATAQPNTNPTSFVIWHLKA